MFRKSWKYSVIGLVVVVALLASVTPATAGWGHRCCGYGGYGGYYSPWYYSGWYSSWGWGGCCGGCYSCYSGWGGCCGDSYGGGIVSSCCGSNDYGTIGVSTVRPALAPTPAAPAPARKPVIESMTPEPAPAPGMPGPEVSKPSASTSAESGVLTVWVPYDAKVTVNGLETRSTGSKRQFISYGLKPGYTYKYVIRASVVRNGQLDEELPQTVTLTAGQITSVAFGFNTAAPQVAAR